MMKMNNNKKKNSKVLVVQVQEDKIMGKIKGNLEELPEQEEAGGEEDCSYRILSLGSIR